MKRIKLIIGILAVMLVAGGGTLAYLYTQQPETFAELASKVGITMESNANPEQTTDPVIDTTGSAPLVLDPNQIVSEPDEGESQVDLSMLTDDQRARIQSGELTMDQLMIELQEASEEINYGEFGEDDFAGTQNEPATTTPEGGNLAGYSDIQWGNPDTETGNDLTQGGSNTTNGLGGLDSFITGGTADMGGIGAPTNSGLPDNSGTSDTSDTSGNSDTSDLLQGNENQNSGTAEVVNNPPVIDAVAPKTADPLNTVQIIAILILVSAIALKVFIKRRSFN